MIIRRANEDDIDGVNDLLYQVLEVHRRGRPDIFKPKAKKYTDGELKKIFSDYSSPVFVAVEPSGKISGYAFCVFQRHSCNGILKQMKTLYVDDLCVDENYRRQHIGTTLLEHVLKFAKANRCYNVTLNVWACNKDALAFYERSGLVPQKTTLEKIL